MDCAGRARTGGCHSPWRPPPAAAAGAAGAPRLARPRPAARAAPPRRPPARGAGGRLVAPAAALQPPVGSSQRPRRRAACDAERRIDRGAKARAGGRACWCAAGTCASPGCCSPASGSHQHCAASSPLPPRRTVAARTMLQWADVTRLALLLGGGAMRGAGAARRTRAPGGKHGREQRCNAVVGGRRRVEQRAQVRRREGRRIQAQQARHLRRLPRQRGRRAPPCGARPRLSPWRECSAARAPARAACAPRSSQAHAAQRGSMRRSPLMAARRPAPRVRLVKPRRGHALRWAWGGRGARAPSTTTHAPLGSGQLSGGGAGPRLRAASAGSSTVNTTHVCSTPDSALRRAPRGVGAQGRGREDWGVRTRRVCCPAAVPLHRRRRRSELSAWPHAQTCGQSAGMTAGTAAARGRGMPAVRAVAAVQGDRHGAALVALQAHGADRRRPSAAAATAAAAARAAHARIVK